MSDEQKPMFRLVKMTDQPTIISVRFDDYVIAGTLVYLDSGAIIVSDGDNEVSQTNKKQGGEADE